MIDMPPLYQKHLKCQLTRRIWILLTILISLLQEHRWVRLENLVHLLPNYIKFQSRRRALQRLLSLPIMTFEQGWFPIFTNWIETAFSANDILYLAIDRTQWCTVNLLVISLVYEGRSLPIYIINLEKKGSSSSEEQVKALSPVLSLLKKYKKVVLGDREFCGVDLPRWLKKQKNTDFCLRLKKSTYIKKEKELWISLQELGLKPGISLYLKGVKVTQMKGFGPVNVAAKWKRQYRGWNPEEAWFVLTNLPDLKGALEAYKKRMGIEQMFRDFKSGGYNLEGTQVRGQRLIALTLLITLAYWQSTIVGKIIKSKGVASYVNRPTEPGRKYRRHSSFYTGNRGQAWLNSLETFAEQAEELMALCPQKRANYRRGQRAALLVQSAF